MLSLWISDHQMNTELNGKIPNLIRKTLPLQKIGGITCANALRVDWNEICPKNKDDEVFVFGNPPYLGARRQDKSQKSDIKICIRKYLWCRRIRLYICVVLSGCKIYRGLKFSFGFRWYEFNHSRRTSRLFME